MLSRALATTLSAAPLSRRSASSLVDVINKQLAGIAEAGTYKRERIITSPQTAKVGNLTRPPPTPVSPTVSVSRGACRRTVHPTLHSHISTSSILGRPPVANGASQSLCSCSPIIVARHVNADTTTANHSVAVLNRTLRRCWSVLAAWLLIS